MADPVFRKMLTKSTRVPVIDDIIDDLVAYYKKGDPDDNSGFANRDIWEWRLAVYEFSDLFEAWLMVKGEGCEHEVLRPSKAKEQSNRPCCVNCLQVVDQPDTPGLPF